MIKFIFIIFFQMFFVSAQDTKETDSFDDKTEELSKNILFSDNKKFIKQTAGFHQTNKIEKNLSIELESSFAITKNNLSKTDYKWKYSIPYIDTKINYQFSNNVFFETSFDFSYEGQSWNYLIESAFIKYHWPDFFSSDLTLGYFEYPILGFKLTDHKFHKKTLLEKNLFPLKTSDMGAFLKVNFWQFFYLKASSQAFTGERELLFPLNTAKNTFTASLNYKKENQSVSASYLKQFFFSKKQKEAFGLGLDLSHPSRSFLFTLEGEFWKIKHQFQNTLSYYILPSIQWKRLVLSFLHGKAYYQLGQQTNTSLEYILKAELYLTDELFFRLERLKEADTIAKNSSWIFSLKSNFNF